MPHTPCHLHRFYSPPVRQLCQGYCAPQSWKFLSLCQLYKVRITSLCPRQQTNVIKAPHTAHRNVNAFELQVGQKIPCRSRRHIQIQHNPPINSDALNFVECERPCWLHLLETLMVFSAIFLAPHNKLVIWLVAFMHAHVFRNISKIRHAAFRKPFV